MSKNDSQETSQKKLEANRRNAQKSTGPRTPRARRTRAEQRQWRYVKSLSYDQAKLGQNPEDFQEFLAEMIADWRPEGAMEMTLVEDLATLEMERRLVDRAQRGRLVARLEREEAEVSRTARRLDDDATPTATREEVVAHGLRNAPDSSGKFRQIMELMEGLFAVVKIGDFSCPAEEIFMTLYGEHPSWRAAQIISSYKHFVERYAEAPHRFPKLIQQDHPANEVAAAPDAQTPFDADESALIDPTGPRPWGEPARAEDGRPSAAENEYRSLRLLMLEEYDAIVSDYHDFIRERADLSRARRDAMLAPNGRPSALMIRQKNSIDRHIERKIKLLLLLQKERRSREDAPPRESRRKLHPGEARATGRNLRPAQHATPAITALRHQAKCKSHRKPVRARRLTQRAYAPARAVPSVIAPWRAMILVAQPLARVMGAARRSFAACAVFVLLCLVLLQPGKAIPYRPVPGQPEAGASSRTASGRGDPGPTEMGGRRRTGAPKLSITRDVFSHFESHQNYENKQNELRAKAKIWLSTASFPTPIVRSHGNSKFEKLKERATQFSLLPSPCDASGTVTLAT